VIAALDRLRLRRLAMPALTMGLMVQFLWYLPVVRASSDGAWAARADVQFARSVVPTLPAHAYVLSQNPGMFQVWGVSAGQVSLATTVPGYLEQLDARHPGGVYLHWNFWCNVQDPVQQAFCTKVLELRPGTLVRESRERDQRFAFYRLDPPGRGR